MAYVPYIETTPDPTSENGTVAFDSTRENLVALRDAIVMNGTFPGWDGEAQDSDDSPSSTPDQPDQWVYSKGTERVKVELTWGSSGGADGNVTEVIASYSANSGTLYEVMGDTGYPLGKMTITYDVDANAISWTWS